jgi:hypothetical protein
MVLPVKRLPHWDSRSPHTESSGIETHQDFSASSPPSIDQTLSLIFPSYTLLSFLRIALQSYTRSASHSWRCHKNHLLHERSTNMSLEDMVGETLQGDDHEYRIQSLQIRDDYLDVYLVTRADNADERYEAQAFAQDLPRENEGLCQARRRRMKRIFRSKNFESEIEHGGKRFLISRVQRNEREWRDLREQVGGRDADPWASWERSMSISGSVSSEDGERRKPDDFRASTKKSSRRGISV